MQFTQQQIQDALTQLENLAPMIEQLASGAASGDTSLTSLLTDAESLAQGAVAIDPALGAPVAIATGLIAVGQRLVTGFKAIQAQTAVTAPAVWQGIVDQGNIDDAAVAAQT